MSSSDFISIETAPRDPNQLVSLRRSVLYRLALQLDIFKGEDQSSEQAFLSADLPAMAQRIAIALQTRDANGGQQMQQQPQMQPQMQMPQQVQPGMQQPMMPPQMQQPMQQPMQQMPMQQMQQPLQQPMMQPMQQPMPPQGPPPGVPGMPPMQLPPMAPPMAPPMQQQPQPQMQMPMQPQQPMAPPPMPMMQQPMQQMPMQQPMPPMAPAPVLQAPAAPLRAPATASDPNNVGASTLEAVTAKLGAALATATVGIQDAMEIFDTRLDAINTSVTAANIISQICLRMLLMQAADNGTTPDMLIKMSKAVNLKPILDEYGVDDDDDMNTGEPGKQ